MFNALDLILLIALMAILGAAFFSGISKTVSSIFAVYLAAICAAAFYEDLTDAAQEYTAIGQTTGELSFFFLTFLCFSMAFTFIISRWLEGMRLPLWFSVVDSIGGAALGLLVAAAAVTVSAMLLSIVVQALQQVALSGDGSLVSIVDDQISESMLVPFFLRLSPYFTSMFEPWFRGGLPQLLVNVS
jgi:uncharacterized membrane protein required for colicin V production